MECKLMYKCLTGKPTCEDHIANAKNCFIPDPAVEQNPETPEADVRLNNLLNAEKCAEAIHYPRCWDTAAYPTLADAIWEALTWAGCSECQKHPET
jgi:hypothetical protein